MKIKTLKLIMKKITVSVIVSSIIITGSGINANALSELESELIENIENKIRTDTISEITMESQTKSSEEVGESEESEADKNKEVSSGDALEVPEEIVYENITINSLEDFIEFSENCKNDAWSTNKIVTLGTDINLSESKFSMIPYFDGIFKGENHEIKGYGNADDSYFTGLFRYVGTNGMVQDLNVTGDIRMKDELKYTGGICGMNLGVIKNCTYLGVIEGNNTVGAIAAINETTGLITGCVNEAHVSGYYFTGGIVGKNYGVVSASTNSGNINDNEEWVVKEDEKGESIIQNITQRAESDQQKVRSGTDTGGIAGYSKGGIVHCTNKGNIGYEHVGYNVGGIAGRQMGIVSYSTNKGVINGRKDIGGIIGQMEPYLEPEDLQTLPEAADKLHDLVEKTLEDMDGGVDSISSDVSNLTEYASGAVDDGRALAGELTTSVNANVRVANAAIERFEYVLQNVPGVINHLEGASDKMYYFNNSLARAVEAIHIDDDLSEDDKDKIDSSENDVYRKLADANEKSQRIEGITSAINDLMYEKDENGNYVFDENGNRILRTLTDEERTQLNSYLAELQQMAADSGGNVYEMFGDVSDILETYKPYAESAEDETLAEAQNAIAALQAAEGELKEAANGTRSIIDYLNAQEELRLSGLGSDWDNSLDSLHENLKGISGSIENINQNGKNTSHTLNSNLEAVNDQVNEIYHILSDRLDIIYNEDATVFTDISDAEIENARTGRVDSSKNLGKVKGDINIGGIAGAMAIDEEDPEENAAGNLNIGRGSKYTLKNIICECKNESTVESKKDGAGLIVGYMAQGIVTSCEGYGLAKSTEGSYVGGIAGQSMSIIRDCDSLCLLNGNNYVGGIAGYGTTITGCNAMITWENDPTERFGSIAGIVNTDSETKRIKLDNIRNNYYVESAIGGIDDIGYAKKAESISYDKLLTHSGIPNDFRHLKVTFEADGEKLGFQELAYGESLEKLDFPEGDLREGYYIKWPDVTGMVMEGSYILSGEYVTTNKAIESDALYEDSGKHIAILGGSYGDDAYIVAEIVDDPVYTIERPVIERGAVVYKIKVDVGSYAQNSERKIRLYNPYSDAEVKTYVDGEWKDTKFRTIGKYLEVELENEEAIYAIVETSPLIKRIIYLVSLFIVMAVIMLLVHNSIKKNEKKLGIRRHHRKDKKDKEAEKNSTEKDKADDGKEKEKDIEASKDNKAESQEEKDIEKSNNSEENKEEEPSKAETQDKNTGAGSGRNKKRRHRRH